MREGEAPERFKQTEPDSNSLRIGISGDNDLIYIRAARKSDILKARRGSIHQSHYPIFSPFIRSITFSWGHICQMQYASLWRLDR